MYSKLSFNNKLDIQISTVISTVTVHTDLLHTHTHSPPIIKRKQTYTCHSVQLTSYILNGLISLLYVCVTSLHKIVSSINAFDIIKLSIISISYLLFARYYKPDTLRYIRPQWSAHSFNTHVLSKPNLPLNR